MGNGGAIKGIYQFIQVQSDLFIIIVEDLSSV